MDNVEKSDYFNNTLSSKTFTFNRSNKSDMNVKASLLGNGAEFGKEISFALSAASDLPSGLLQHCARALDHPAHAAHFTITFLFQLNQRVQVAAGQRTLRHEGLCSLH
jgi:hypothetical protein